VFARYGVHPWQWCDYRALTGDHSDGIAGVPGVGAKTAARLLADGRTLETLASSGRLGGRGWDSGSSKYWDQVLAWGDFIRLRHHRTAQSSRPPRDHALPAPATILEELKLW